MRRPRVSTEASPVLVDLLKETLSLYEADAGFALASSSPTHQFKIADDIGELLAAISSLVVGQGPDNVKLQAKQAVVAIFRQISHDSASRTDKQSNKTGIAFAA